MKREAISVSKFPGENLMGKCFGLLLTAFLLLTVSIGEAQQPKKVPRIGYVRMVGVQSTPGIEAFRRGLRALGYVEGENIVIEFRYAEGKPDRIPSLVDELVQLKVDVIVSGDDPAIRLAKQATKTIPIVMLINQDPVATGLIDSLARPGGNITGISRLTRELSGKRLELLTEVVPGMERVGILWDSTSEGSKISFQEYQAVSRALKIQLKSLDVRGPEPDLDGAFQSAVKGRTSTLVVVGGGVLNRHRKQIANYAIKHRLPSMYDSRLWIEPGGLISYSSDDIREL